MGPALDDDDYYWQKMHAGCHKTWFKDKKNRCHLQPDCLNTRISCGPITYLTDGPAFIYLFHCIDTLGWASARPSSLESTVTFASYV